MPTVRIIVATEVPVGVAMTQDGKKVGTVIHYELDQEGRHVITAEVEQQIIDDIHKPHMPSFSYKIKGDKA